MLAVPLLLHLSPSQAAKPSYVKTKQWLDILFRYSVPHAGLGHSASGPKSAINNDRQSVFTSECDLRLITSNDPKIKVYRVNAKELVETNIDAATDNRIVLRSNRALSSSATLGKGAKFIKRKSMTFYTTSRRVAERGVQAITRLAQICGPKLDDTF